MIIGKSGVRTVLILLYATAVLVRLHHSGALLYPYYKGESGTNFRLATLVNEAGGLPAIDTKMSWPEGYEPSRVTASGVEYFTGFAFRLIDPFSDMSYKKFVGILSILIFSLCVFTFFMLAQSLWVSPAAGLFAAFLVALSGPLIEVTHGREYGHAPYALLLISLQLYILASHTRTPRTALAVLSAVSAFAILGVWQTADFYLVFLGLITLFLVGLSSVDLRRFFTVHLAALVLAGIVLPHLRAERFLLKWQALFFVVATVYAYTRHRLSPRIPGSVYVGVATILLAVLAKPFTAGGIDGLSEVEYWLSRFRFLTSKPEDPMLLSDAARFMWTHAHAYPTPRVVLEFFLPLLVLLPPSILALRHVRQNSRRTVWLAIGGSLFGTVVFLLDRSAIFAAALGIFSMLAVAVHSLDKHVKTRFLAVALAMLLVLLQALPVSPRANATQRLATALGLTRQGTDGFLWVSLGNADQELVRFVVSNTSVKEPWLAPPPMSSLLVAFAGRTAVLSAGIWTRHEMQRTRTYMHKFFRDEEELFNLCHARGVTYVLYSIDLLLDMSKYSQSYGIGARHIDRGSLAYRMHFKPETLRHFNLIYQNDNYRLFRVTEEMEPLFLTDHPPVYQQSILSQEGENLQSFYETVIDILVTYQTAVDAQSRRDDEDAIRRFRYCLDIAPRFTKAWLGLGDSLFRLGQIEAAKAAYQEALRNAPDNSQALYNTALTMARLGDVEEALGLLEVLISSSRDRRILAQARELKSVLERGIPVDAPRQ